jgi:hypothetical protein
MSAVPKGALFGGFLALVTGFVPIVNLLGAGAGGMLAAYIEQYGVVRGGGVGFVIGLLGLVPLVLYATAALFVVDTSLPFLMTPLLGLGLLSVFGCPICGALGGHALGFAESVYGIKIGR